MRQSKRYNASNSSPSLRASLSFPPDPNYQQSTAELSTTSTRLNGYLSRSNSQVVTQSFSSFPKVKVTGEPPLDLEDVNEFMSRCKIQVEVAEAEWPSQPHRLDRSIAPCSNSSNYIVHLHLPLIPLDSGCKVAFPDGYCFNMSHSRMSPWFWWIDNAFYRLANALILFSLIWYHLVLPGIAWMSSRWWSLCCFCPVHPSVLCPLASSGCCDSRLVSY